MVFHLYELTHKHFPNFADCRPIFIARTLVPGEQEKPCDRNS
jgi:hypothetical protein